MVARISSQEDIRTGTTDPHTIAVTVNASAKALVVGVVHGESGAGEQFVSMSLGGQSFTEVITAFDNVTENGAAQLWFLANPPTGAQTLTIDLASATTVDIHTVIWQLSSSGPDLEVIDSDFLEQNQANPVVTMNKAGRSAISLAIMYGGGAAPGGTLAAGNTLDHTHDLGAFYSQSCYETTVDTADHSIGWSSLASDDLAFVAIAVGEVSNDRRLRLSFAELELPTAPRRAQLSFAEFEVPTAPRRAQVSWAEFEVPTADVTRRLQLSFAELETPTAPRRGQVSFMEFEVPTAPRRLQFSFAEFEVPTAPRRMQVSFAEFEVALAPRRMLLSFAEFEIPTAPRRAYNSYMAFEVPGGDPPPGGSTRKAKQTWTVGIERKSG